MASRRELPHAPNDRYCIPGLVLAPAARKSAGLKIPEAKFDELKAGRQGGTCSPWLTGGARRAWNLDLDGRRSPTR
jgi:hypothetical protein